MEKSYVFGHINPDTDSVCAAITLANLKRELGFNVEERVLGTINKETEYVLKYWNFKEPKYLNDVKLKIKNLNYRKNCFMDEYSSILEVYNYMLKENTTGVPIVDKNKKLINLITAKEILRKTINITDNTLNTSYDNIVFVLNAKEIVKCDEEINGKITAVSFAHSTFESIVDLSHEDILIVGDRHYIIDLAINAKVKLIILIGNAEIKEEHISLARKNKVNIIKTPMNTFETSRLIMYSNYIRKILNDFPPYFVNDTDYYDSFIEESSSLKIDNYPIVDKNGICKGLLRKSEINKLDKKKVILVDHNETDQSAIGLEEAEITEIVDHHRIGQISTSSPINFRSMIVGSTNTIIYLLYKENGIRITKPIAGLMISAIISDTLLFKSPTTTEIDKYVVKELNKICKLDIEQYGLEMFKKGSSLEGRSITNIINDDSKIFNAGEISFIVSQVFTMDYESILNNKEEYIKEIENSKTKKKVNHFIFVITDIIENGSYFLYDNDSVELIKKAFHDSKMTYKTFIKNSVSRKKQIVPLIIDALEK